MFQTLAKSSKSGSGSELIRLPRLHAIWICAHGFRLCCKDPRFAAYRLHFLVPHHLFQETNVSCMTETTPRPPPPPPHLAAGHLRIIRANFCTSLHLPFSEGLPLLLADTQVEGPHKISIVGMSPASSLRLRFLADEGSRLFVKWRTCLPL